VTLFDVILPTRGRAHTIGFAIASVLDQTIGDFTLEVVGDGCDEATERAVRGVDDPRIRFSRFEKGVGFGYANRNAVLRRGRSPYVAYMTDDDLMFPDHLERARTALDRPGPSLAAFRASQVRFPDDLDPNFFAFDWNLGFFSEFLRNGFIGSANLVHRRSLFDRIGYWDETLVRFGDREFHSRARRAGEATYRDEVTLLRFFAAQWDRRYALLSEPPQARYAEKMRDPEWRRSVRRRAADGPRGVSLRLAQARDFMAFALRSGPRFVRFAVRRPFRRIDIAARGPLG
jgi:glycosyltransferase involved in cell wall biosynthesis